MEGKVQKAEQGLTEKQLQKAKTQIVEAFERRWAGLAYDLEIDFISKQMKKSPELAEFVREDIGKQEVIEFIKLSYFPNALKEIRAFGIPLEFLATEPALSAVKIGLLRILKNKHFGEIERTLSEFPFPEEVLKDNEIVSAARDIRHEALSLKQSDLANVITDKFHLSEVP